MGFFVLKEAHFEVCFAFLELLQGIFQVFRMTLFHLLSLWHGSIGMAEVLIYVLRIYKYILDGSYNHSSNLFGQSLIMGIQDIIFQGNEPFVPEKNLYYPLVPKTCLRNRFFQNSGVEREYGTATPRLVHLYLSKTGMGILE